MALVYAGREELSNAGDVTVSLAGHRQRNGPRLCNILDPCVAKSAEPFSHDSFCAREDFEELVVDEEPLAADFRVVKQTCIDECVEPS